MLLFIENNNTKNGKKKKEGKNELSRTRTRGLPLNATTPNHYTTEADYVTLGKSLNAFSIEWNFGRQDDRAALTEILTVKKTM